jgi:hypothetical protein
MMSLFQFFIQLGTETMEPLLYAGTMPSYDHRYNLFREQVLRLYKHQGSHS